MLERLEELVLEKVSLAEQVDDEGVRVMIDEVLEREAKTKFFTVAARHDLRRRLMHSLRGLDVLEDLLEDPDITEIMVNGAQKIFYEKGGKISRWEETFRSEQRLYDVIQQIVSRVNRVVNESTPVVDARLADGSRVHVVLPPAALDGAILTIRRFGRDPLTMERLVENGSLTREAADELEVLVRAGYNIFISGGTDSGKTTFLNALSAYIPGDERIITIEDSAELQIKGIENLVRLEARNKNLEGDLQITIRDLIRAALRMRPDRIIVGEVRDEAALDMLQAMNTGHDGSLSTGHANSPADMLRRLETMVMMGSELSSDAIRAQIASALDVLVHLERMRDGRRRVVSIMEVDGYEETSGHIGLRELYSFEEDGRADRASGAQVDGRLVRKDRIRHTEKLAKAGYLQAGDERDCSGSGGGHRALRADGMAVLQEPAGLPADPPGGGPVPEDQDCGPAPEKERDVREAVRGHAGVVRGSPEGRLLGGQGIA